MRRLFPLLLLLVVGACSKPAPSSSRDARFITLGDLAADLARDPATFDAVVDKLGTDVGALSTAQKTAMRQLFSRADYRALDRLPETSLSTLQEALALLAASRPLTLPQERSSTTKAPEEALALPTKQAAPTGEPFLKDIGLGLQHGDRIDAKKRPRYADSVRLAAALEKLATGTASISIGGPIVADAPETLLALLKMQGHTVAVVDERFAANFGDLEKGGVAVATPLWVTTGKVLADGSTLALPVPHAQLRLEVRGPVVNADVTLYPALDLAGDGSGGTRFRADVTADQAWCGGVVAHRYEGKDADKAIDVMGQLRRFADERVRAKQLPLDGYFALGVCTLAPALVEQAVLGKSTVWPLTHDPALFDGDTAIDALAKRLPSDRTGAVPDDARLQASLPWASLRDVPFAHSRAQLKALGWLPEAP